MAGGVAPRTDATRELQEGEGAAVGMSLTPMERSILRLVADRHWPQFDVERIDAVSRENTGVGRFTYLVDRAEQPVPDGLHAAGDYTHIQMEGVPDGLFFVVVAERSRLHFIEIVSAGDDSWDGVERVWSFV